MSDHLPECFDTGPGPGLPGDCICERLRAAEQRVRDTFMDSTPELTAYRKAQYAKGYADALRDAREAVAAVRPKIRLYGGKAVWRKKALAAIDALRGEA